MLVDRVSQAVVRSVLRAWRVAARCLAKMGKTRESLGGAVGSSGGGVGR